MFILTAADLQHTELNLYDDVKTMHPVSADTVVLFRKSYIFSFWYTCIVKVLYFLILEYSTMVIDSYGALNLFDFLATDNSCLQDSFQYPNAQDSVVGIG